MSYSQIALDALSQTSYLIINKSLLRAFKGDANETVMLTELVTLYNGFQNTDQVKSSNGWFFRSVEDVEKDICFNDYKQRTALKSLIERGLVELRRAGNPAKRYFKLNLEKIGELLTTPIVTVSVDSTKKEKQKDFYKSLNDSLKLRDFKKFEKGNLKVEFAEFLYNWSLLYRQVTHTDWEWTPESLGKLNIWFTRQIIKKSKVFDYSTLYNFFIKGNLGIQEWIKYYSITPENDPAFRITSPKWRWID